MNITKNYLARGYRKYMLKIFIHVVHFVENRPNNCKIAGMRITEVNESVDMVRSRESSCSSSVEDRHGVIIGKTTNAYMVEFFAGASCRSNDRGK